MNKDILEELLQTIEANAIDNKVTITNVSLWADSWRKEQSLLFRVNRSLPTSKERISALKNSLDYFYTSNNEGKREAFSNGFDNCYRWIKDYVRKQR